MIGGVMLPALGAARRNVVRMENTTRIRGIQQAMLQYAQGNNQKFPGLGKDNDLTVEGRFQMLLDGNYLTPEDLISPAEPATAAPFNHSFRLLKIANEGGRRAAWGSTANWESPVVSDRNTGPSAGANARSIHSTRYWRGSVAYNDGHTNFLGSNIIGSTRYGDVQNIDDDLFATTGTDDVMMIHEGQ